MTAGTFALRRAAVVYVALLCAVEVFALEDPTAIRIPQSASTVTNFNCVRPTPVTRLVRFQSFNVSGSQYERVSVADEVMSFYFREGAKTKTFIASSLGMCLLAVGKAGMDAVQFVDNTCTGYNLSASDMVCRCSSGTNLVFVKSSKIQSTVPKGGYTKTNGNFTLTLIYQSTMFVYVNIQDDLISTNCFTSKAQMASNVQYYAFHGYPFCFGSYTIIDTSQCTSSCSLTPIVVISPLNPRPNKYFLDSCGSTITIPLSPDTKTPTVILSHDGLRCSLYPQPATDTECAVTFVAADATVGKLTISYSLVLSSNADACQDDLTIYDGADATGSTLLATTCATVPGIASDTTSVPAKAYVVFKRRAAVSGASPPVGFYLSVSGKA